MDELDVEERREPEWALVVERLEWGRFYGFPQTFKENGEVLADSPAEVWEAYESHRSEVGELRDQIREIETHQIGQASREEEESRLELRGIGLKKGEDSAAYLEAKQDYDAIAKRTQGEIDRLRSEIAKLDEKAGRFVLGMRTAGGVDVDLRLADIVRIVAPNRMGLGDKTAVYVSRWWEFLSADPREANAEGGVFPAIFGTVVMTLLMCIVVVPFGILAALYLHEYAKQGLVVAAVRIAVNNLAGVPSIVFGVFGLGFFCYIVGAGVDELLFESRLPNPTFGTGGLLWASLTLSLLTLPVVIVATEEALAAVPRSNREGAYACGASKWQTIRTIVLPRAMPGIMTGMILAMARGAGEVAPLMLVGAVKLAPDLPMDGVFPFIHPQRSFMHLGFHVFDLGFQSQNSEAAKPMVFTTTLLLITIIAALNIAAIMIRTRLSKRFEGGKF